MDKSKREKSLKKGSERQENQDKEALTPSLNTSKSSTFKCFKCLGKGYIVSLYLNKRTMIIKEDVEIDSESSQENNTSSRERKMKTKSQRENIFHTRFLVLGKVCSPIIDGRSSVNVASLRLVEKLDLPTLPYPKPYKLQWLSKKKELVVDRKVKVTFSIGGYKDEILCDVMPIDATHILLGRS
ncbi:hypothetical protein CR513_13410, partial [Mucuna pruriens]